MKLRDYLRILNRRKWFALLTLLAVVGTVGIASVFAHPTYTSTVTLRLAMAATGDISYSDVSYLPVLMNTYATIATSSSIRDELARQLNVSELPKLSAEVVQGTELLQISAEASTAALAHETANTLADLLVLHSGKLYAGANEFGSEKLGQDVAELEGKLRDERAMYIIATDPDELIALEQAIAQDESALEKLLDQYERARVQERTLANTLSVADPASLPEEPSSPRRARDLGLAVVVGLFGGVGVALLLENLDNTVRASSQIKQITRLPILGEIQSYRKHQESGVFGADSPAGRAFAWLAACLLNVNCELSNRTLLVTSASPGEGKSTVVANLAGALGRLGLEVIVVDCNLHQPVLHDWFSVRNTVGLTSVLQDGCDLDQAIRKTGQPGVSVLTSGPRPNGPGDWLGRKTTREMVNQLTARFDCVLLDCSALSDGPEGAMIAPASNGVLLVIESGKTRRRDIVTALGQLDAMGATPIGVVVNRAEARGD